MNRRENSGLKSSLLVLVIENARSCCKVILAVAFHAHSPAEGKRADLLTITSHSVALNTPSLVTRATPTSTQV